MRFLTEGEAKGGLQESTLNWSSGNAYSFSNLGADFLFDLREKKM